jgi:hypothetical protein
MKASSRSLLVAIDFCSLGQATPEETLDPGLPGRIMAALSVALPPVGVIYGGWFWLEGS